jgi:hypothetical protein
MQLRYRWWANRGERSDLSCDARSRKIVRNVRDLYDPVIAELEDRRKPARADAFAQWKFNK